ncbi:hypothetical protein HBA54_13105 [Pelagibius litoralis]|uniref:Uncharacterized protein n=1 Tax=Pelagibius litoralis TaxID=374515 RepID=A0A967EY24_9PROT|nr:hypothetical protein [Pelagibius litoralis]NIA69533.1 hypothetical protein [Pelagibius litoralis]
MSSKKYGALAIFFLLFLPTQIAQADINKFCQEIIPETQAFYSSDSRIRINQSFLCLNHDAKIALFVGEAAAMEMRFHVGVNNAPWLYLSILDKDLNVAWH